MSTVKPQGPSAKPPTASGRDSRTAFAAFDEFNQDSVSDFRLSLKSDDESVPDELVACPRV